MTAAAHKKGHFGLTHGHQFFRVTNVEFLSRDKSQKFRLTNTAAPNGDGGVGVLLSRRTRLSKPRFARPDTQTNQMNSEASAVVQ
jgi:hypothetical protein